LIPFPLHRTFGYLKNTWSVMVLAPYLIAIAALKREGYVEGIDKKNKCMYSIITKGRKLLQGLDWFFVSLYYC
jgi:hypothetical protein